MAPADSSVEDLIERLARQARSELQRMTERALDEIGTRLGYLRADLKRQRRLRRRRALRAASFP